MCERLAEIKKSYRNNVGLEGRTIFWLISEVERLERIDRVTAEALASARAEVERLKVEKRGLRLRAEKKELDSHFDAGMERAAKIADEEIRMPHEIAAAIRAEAKQ